MCMIEDCDEHYTVLSQTNPVARKEHICGECRRAIQPGEPYERMVGFIDPREGIHSEKTCAHCLMAREWLNKQCGGFVFQMVREDLEEHWNDEPLLRSVWLARVLIGMQKHWQTRHGLMPVPAEYQGVAA